jgi:phasin family protein
MSSLVPEQLIATQKAGLETMFGFLIKALEGVENLVELNVQVVKSTLTESQEILTEVFAARDPQELLALQANRPQATAEKVQSYWRAMCTKSCPAHIPRRARCSSVPVTSACASPSWPAR